MIARLSKEEVIACNPCEQAPDLSYCFANGSLTIYDICELDIDNASKIWAACRKPFFSEAQLFVIAEHFFNQVAHLEEIHPYVYILCQQSSKGDFIEYMMSDIATLGTASCIHTSVWSSYLLSLLGFNREDVRSKQLSLIVKYYNVFNELEGK